MPGWISRDDRDAVLLAGSAVLADGRVVEVSVTDLSREAAESNQTKH